MLTNEQIKKVIDSCKDKGFTVSVRDICFVGLQNVLSDHNVIYKSLFGNDSDFDINYLATYESTACIQYLSVYIPSLLNESLINEDKIDFKDISFEENKAEMLKIIEQTKRAEADGKIEVEKSLRIQADLRCKLNDKFKVQEENKEQMIIVNTKYTGVCEYCGHEIEEMSKAEAMKRYNLVEK